MALDPEEFKMRRQKRQQDRRAQHNRTLVKLILAVLALILVGALIFIVVSNGSEPQNTESSSNTSVSQETGNDEDTVIHFVATGDLNITDAVVSSGGATYDYTQTFLDVSHILADADLTAVNLEGNFYGSPYGTDTASAPESLAKALRVSGVDIVQLANSYSIAHGLSGLSATIEGVKKAGMEPLGVYATQKQAQASKGYTICQVQGIKIAFVAFTKGMNGLALPAGSEKCVNVLYTDYQSTYQKVNTQGITQVLNNVAKEEPDITIAMLHWGSEFNDTISVSQKEICALMLDNGVDAIIGTHPHYVQKIDFDAQTGSFVAYSLGDFISDAQRAGTEYSILLDLEITKSQATGKTQVTDYSYTPIFTAAEENKPLRVLRIHEAIAAYESGYIDRVSQKNYEAMKYALTRIEARVAGK